MKLELDLTEHQLAQLMFALGKACTRLDGCDDSKDYAAMQNLRALATLISQSCEGAALHGYKGMSLTKLLEHGQIEI